MTKFSFVILHYNTFTDTIECIDSIKKYISARSRDIIVVDNCSPDSSGSLLKLKYAEDDEVQVLMNSENLGFARGNNVGFKYAKERGADFIVMLNNDTLLLDNSFCYQVENEYKLSHFAVLGPMVITPTPPYDSNPGRNQLPSKGYCRRQIVRYCIYALMNWMGVDMCIRSIMCRITHKKSSTKAKEINKRVENVQLHGCFWIFSPNYIEQFDGINARTFLYHEEELLFLRLKKCGLKSVYLPTLKIYHKEDRATNSIKISNRKRQMFVYKHLILSHRILLDELSGRDCK